MRLESGSKGVRVTSAVQVKARNIIQGRRTSPNLIRINLDHLQFFSPKHEGERKRRTSFFLDFGCGSSFTPFSNLTFLSLAFSSLSLANSACPDPQSENDK